MHIMSVHKSCFFSLEIQDIRLFLEIFSLFPGDPLSRIVQTTFQVHAPENEELASSFAETETFSRAWCAAKPHPPPLRIKTSFSRSSPILANTTTRLKKTVLQLEWHVQVEEGQSKLVNQRKKSKWIEES
jgi:hypothetical protein